MPNALPVRRRHASQWHIDTFTGSPTQLTPSCPQLHCACRLIIITSRFSQSPCVGSYRTARDEVLCKRSHASIDYDAAGQTQTLDGVYPTQHQEHETVELTQGLTDWSELGFYIFTSEQDGRGVHWVGDHIRPRVSVPQSWGWPAGVSLSTEVGFQRTAHPPDTWTWEIRPIIDKSIGRWYLAVNPALERTLHGPECIRVGVSLRRSKSAMTSRRW